MPTETKPPNIKEYAGGWITEKKGTDVPTFLKYAYIVIVLGCVSYALVYMNGVTGETGRGLLVAEFNRATEHSDVFMYIVAALALIAGILVIRFAFKKVHLD